MLISNRNPTRRSFPWPQFSYYRSLAHCSNQPRRTPCHAARCSGSIVYLSRGRMLVLAENVQDPAMLVSALSYDDARRVQGRISTLQAEAKAVYWLFWAGAGETRYPGPLPRSLLAQQCRIGTKLAADVSDLDLFCRKLETGPGISQRFSRPRSRAIRAGVFSRNGRRSESGGLSVRLLAMQ